MTVRGRRGGNSLDYQLMFLGDVDSTPGGESIETGEGLLWDETTEKFVHTQLDPAKVRQNQKVYNVQDYGAVGDGLTDDATAIQDALNAAAATGGTVFFPDAQYLIGTTLDYSSGTVLQGPATLIHTYPSADYIMLKPVADGVENVVIEKLTFDQRGDLVGYTGSDYCLSVKNTSNVTVQDCVFDNTITMAIWADSVSPLVTKGTRIVNNHITSSMAGGVSVFGNIRDMIITHNRIENCKDDAVGLQDTAEGGYPSGIIVSHNTLVDNNTRNVSGSTPHSVLVYGCVGVTITDNVMGATVASSVSVQSGADRRSSRVVVANNLISDSGITEDDTTGVPGHGVMVLHADKVQVMNNIINGSRQYGIGVADADVLNISYNQLFDNTGGTISVETSTNVVNMFNDASAPTFANGVKAGDTSQGKIEQKYFSLADGAAAVLTTNTGYQGNLGLVIITNLEDGSVALFAITGGNVVTFEISDPLTQYSNTVDTPNSTNVYNQGGAPFSYYIQNKRGGVRTYYVFLLTATT